MSQQNRVTLNTLADTNVNDNTSGDVTPSDIRTVLKNLADSNLNLLNDDISGLTAATGLTSSNIMISQGGVLKKADSNLFNIITFPSAHTSTGTVTLTFDQIKIYPDVTQTGNITLAVAGSGNVRGVTQELTIVGDNTSTLTLPASFAPGNGVIFNNTKVNDIYLEYKTPTRIIYNILISNGPDVTAPTLLTAIIENANPSNIVLTYNESLTVSPLPTTTDFTLNLGKTVTTVAISGSVVTLTVNTPYVNGNAPTVTYTSGTNKIKDLASNNAANLSSQAVTNNIASVIASDDFTSANITDITGRVTPVGAKTWLHSFGTGTVGIVSNEAKVTSAVGTANEWYVFDAGIRNVDVTFTIGTAAVGTTNLYAAYTDINNYIVLTDGGVLRQSVSGTLTTFFTGTAWANADVYRIVLTSTTVTLFKNTTQIHTSTNGASVTGTRVGFSIYQNISSSINAISVQ